MPPKVYWIIVFAVAAAFFALAAVLVVVGEAKLAAQLAGGAVISLGYAALIHTLRG